DFMRNRYVTQVYNGDLFLNAAGWLTGSEEFATIDRKRPRVTMADLTQAQFANFRFMALFLLPEAILMLGIVNWWRRKTCRERRLDPGAARGRRRPRRVGVVR